jgi:hypothetical protein
MLARHACVRGLGLTVWVARRGQGLPRLHLPSASPVSAAVPARGKEGKDPESKPELPYVPGALCEKKAAEKHDTYHGDNGRFDGLTKKQLVVPSYDAMGGCTEETKEFTLLIIKAVAAAFPDVHPAVIARRVWSTISCALIRSIAVNALDYRNGKLLAPSRSVGGLSPASGSQASGGSRRRGAQSREPEPQAESQGSTQPVRREARGLLAAAVAAGGVSLTGPEGAGEGAVPMQLDFLGEGERPEPEVTGGAASVSGGETPLLASESEMATGGAVLTLAGAGGGS